MKPRFSIGKDQIEIVQFSWIEMVGRGVCQSVLLSFIDNNC